MHHLLCILAALCLASAIPLPQYDSLTSSDIVASNPLDTVFTDTPSIFTYSPDSPDSPLLLSENWSNPGVDQSWTGKDRQQSDSTGMGPRPNGTPSLGGTWPATPNRDGSHAPVFNPKPQGPNDGAAPVPLDTAGGGGAAGAATFLINGILNNTPQGLRPAGP